MSGINDLFGKANVNVFDEHLFRREDDCLNVFKETGSNQDLNENFNVVTESPNQKWNSSQLPEILDLVEVEVDDKSHGATFDFQEINQSLNGDFESLDNSFLHERFDENWWSIPESATYLGEGIFTNQNVSLSTDEISPLSRPMTSYTINDSSIGIEKITDEPTIIRAKTKLFSRRKDVIIKTLLRKCRKFFLKDFNVKTNYLKSIKRKFGSSVYKTLLEDYITKVFQIPCTEKLLIFMGSFLYQKDLEDNLDLFVSPNFWPNEIMLLITSVHNILYRYSHQKFKNFSKNEEFKFVFTYFEEVGTDEVKQDQEYALGLDLIKGQL
jgi:hypothetical protein